MTRGSWEGSGTFKTGGPGPLPVILVVAVLALLGSGAAARAAKDLVTILIIGAVVVVVVVAVTAFLIWRLAGSRLVFRSPPPEAVTPAVKPQVAASSPPASIENHYHGPSIHIHGGGHEEAASLIRKALSPGEAGDAITERNDHDS